MQTLTPLELESARNAVVALLPAALVASQLRAMGIRRVAQPKALAVLAALHAQELALGADIVIGNLFPSWHPEVQG